MVNYLGIHLLRIGLFEDAYQATCRGKKILLASRIEVQSLDNKILIYKTYEIHNAPWGWDIFKIRFQNKDFKIIF